MLEEIDFSKFQRQRRKTAIKNWMNQGFTVRKAIEIVNLLNKR